MIRIADGTVKCKCSRCHKLFQEKDGWKVINGDRVLAYLCHDCTLDFNGWLIHGQGGLVIRDNGLDPKGIDCDFKKADELLRQKEMDKATQKRLGDMLEREEARLRGEDDPNRVSNIGGDWRYVNKEFFTVKDMLGDCKIGNDEKGIYIEDMYGHRTYYGDDWVKANRDIMKMNKKDKETEDMTEEDRQKSDGLTDKRYTDCDRCIYRRDDDELMTKNKIGATLHPLCSLNLRANRPICPMFDDGKEVKS